MKSEFILEIPSKLCLFCSIIIITDTDSEIVDDSAGCAEITSVLWVHN